VVGLLAAAGQLGESTQSPEILGIMQIIGALALTTLGTPKPETQTLVSAANLMVPAEGEFTVVLYSGYPRFMSARSMRHLFLIINCLIKVFYQPGD
jgi:hypothetical protein